MRLIRQGMCLWAAVFVIFASTAHAQSSVSPEDEYKKLIKVDQDVAPLSANPFGETIDLYDGSLSFNETDVSIPGTGPALTLARSLETTNGVDYAFNAQRPFADWDLDIPRIETNSAYQGNVVAWETSSQNLQRCSYFSPPPPVSPSQQGADTWGANQWWYGYHLIIPGQGSQELMPRVSQNALTPTISGMTFDIVTKQNWMISCGVLTDNQAVDNGGEGFMAVSPDGSRYTFAHLVYRPLPSITSPLGTAPMTVNGPKGVSPLVAPFNILQRRLALMYVTKIQDRFGNTLTYDYSGNNLVSITASDGRQLTLSYVPGTALVQTVTAQASNVPTRTWTYSYDTSNSSLPALTGVQLPDGSAWSYQLGAFQTAQIVTEGGDCNSDTVPILESAGASGSITHPSGLTGTFTLTPILHGRSYVPKQCYGDAASNGQALYSTFPQVYYQQSISSKIFTGAGISTQKWTYTNSALSRSWSSDSCATAGTCATTVFTDVVDPNGNDVRYTFSNRFDSTEGQLLNTTYANGAAGNPLLRSEANTYANPTAGPWPTQYGQDLQGRDNASQVTEASPLQQRTITDAGGVYTWQVLAFNIYTAPKEIDRYSSATGQHFTEQMSYLNDPALWVLSLPLQTTNAVTNEVEELNTYTTNDTLLSRARFGQTLMNYTFNSAGQLASFTDGDNNTTQLNNYYRGIPRSISYPDSTTESVGVDDLGQVSSLTDQAGNTTSYTYDGVGRVTQVSYPTGDTVTWLPKNFTYTFVTSAERSIAANHWRRTITQGNYNDVSYFDAELRPILDDTSITGVANSDISTGNTYNWKSQPLFASYPVKGTPDLSTLVSDPGIHYIYDALKRIQETDQDSELGTLATQTAYISGAGMQVTDPNGNVTTTHYQVFDQPSYSAVISVAAPTGITQATTRDVYGNPTAITQSGLYNGTENDSVTRSILYDAYHRVCRTVDPETGSTVMAYDGANNLSWSATGQTITEAGCGQDQVVAAAQTTRTYDPMNRVHVVTPPAGTQSTTYQYDALGRVQSSVSGAATQGYSYNKLGLLTGEALQVPGYSWTLGYGFDAYGHLSTIQYPTGEILGYAPNPRGRTTQASSYASGLSYYPNGSEQTHTLGNGITALTQQNTRLLPFNLSYALGGTQALNEAYVYDKDANLSTITDIVNGQNTQSLSYDGLNRLISASAPNAWGTESYTYDALNNLRSRLTGGITFSQVYNANQQLVSLNAGGSVFASYTHDPQGNRSSVTAYGATQPYVFDKENQLLSVTGVSSYAYDADGHRVSKTLASGVTTYSMYNHAGQLMFAYAPSTGIYTSYIYLNGKLIARHAGNTITYLLTDRLGSPVRETDTSGNVTASFSFRPYGTFSGPSENEPAFTGHVSDTETAFSYMLARYNDGGVGQFLSVDPKGPTPGDVFGFNRYAYASNNPITHIDPDGRESACVTMKSGCGGDNPAAKAAVRSIGNALLGVLDSAANKWNDTFHSGTPEGGQITPDNNSTAYGMMAGNLAISVAGTLATDGEKPPEVSEMMSPKSLLPTEKPGSGAVGRLANDMKANGYNSDHPISVATINGKTVILDGNHRAAAAVKAGIQSVPVVRSPLSQAASDAAWSDAMNTYQDSGKH
jgi:RHS repeat-associated protein